MNARLQQMADQLRQNLGTTGGQGAVRPGSTGRRSASEMLGKKRMVVAVCAVLFGIVSAIIELPRPAEDAYTAARAHLRLRPAPQDIAMIAIDDATLNELKVALPTREHDSRVIDQLVAAGVEKIVFDRAHADPETPRTDAVFAQTLARHRGKVWLGMTGPMTNGFKASDPVVPLKQFRANALQASMAGYMGPFGFAIQFPTSIEFNAVSYPTISAILAGYVGEPLDYRPDYAFDPKTIPTFRYIDVLRGRIGPNQLAGKSVIVGRSFIESPDFHYHPIYGKIAGPYFHILGAHTLKRSAPINLFFFPAMLVAAFVIIWQARGRPKGTRAFWIVVFALLLVPFALDEFAIYADIMPAMLAIGFAAFGFHRINRKYYNVGVDAMTTSAISSERPSSERDVYALKIANLAELSENWSEREIGDFVNTLIAYIRGPGEVGDIAFDRDILVWLAPRMETTDLERHADGLAMMLKTAISHDWQSSQGAPALGIDTNHDLPVALRIKRAMQAAEEAGSRGVRFIINDAAHIEARNHRLGLIRILEKGLRDRDIGVAYQPKIDLSSGRIVGAETLIRWRPDGGELINPQDLVLAAEAGDRINELTLVIMEAALIDGKQAITLDPRFKLAVNMSAKSLSDTHLLFDIMTLLGRFDFPAENLTLELTETAKLEDHRIAPQIAALKARGIGLSIDDFGTGESNLEYIEKLPSSELKIDKRFVQHMATSEESRAVVRATIEIAHSLGKIVVAEGVEEFSVAAALRAMGCDQAQGYLFSQAIAMPELLAMMGGRQAILTA